MSPGFRVIDTQICFFVVPLVGYEKSYTHSHFYLAVTTIMSPNPNMHNGHNPHNS